MNKIHLLPTDKPSKLVKGDTTGRLLLHNSSGTSTDLNTTQHLYITSDEEIISFSEINSLPLSDGKDIQTNIEGSWLLDTKDNRIHKALQINKGGYIVIDLEKRIVVNKSYCKKIILTTNTQLITDGVQAIDDEFLEWFVKNPSCEEVEVKTSGGRYSYDMGGNIWIPIRYKIIIPSSVNNKKECIVKKI
jgi:hypothetical protein